MHGACNTIVFACLACRTRLACLICLACFICRTYHLKVCHFCGSALSHRPTDKISLILGAFCCFSCCTWVCAATPFVALFYQKGCPVGCYFFQPTGILFISSMRLGCAEIPLVLMYSVANPLIVQQRFILPAMDHVLLPHPIGHYAVTPGPTVNRTIAFLVALPPCGQKSPFGLGLFIYVRALCGNRGLVQNLFYFALHCPHRGLATGRAPVRL